MCGITGVAYHDGRLAEGPTLAAMCAAIAHRGPDDEGVLIDRSVGLGSRRLAIIDLTKAGHQPLTNEDGAIVVTYNGEIFNFRELRSELEEAGHRFRSRTDTEVVVHAYEEWGEASVARFNGQFAFCIYDRRHQRLFLARDRFGIKPLYYLSDGGRFIFGSEIKAILAHPDVRRTVCYPALNQYFTFQNVLTDETLFEGIHLLPPGHWMRVDVGSARAPERRQYWDYRVGAEPSQLSLEEAAEEVQRLFVQAVNRQLVSDVPIASYLSGGMDSSSIVAVARQSLGRLTTFTGGFDLSSASGLEMGFDERAHAEALANAMKTEHYEIVLHAGDMEHVMPELIRHLEDLRVGQCYPNYYLARLASKFVKVVLSGAGGDELFGGYPWRYYRGIESHDREDFYRKYYAFWQRLVPDEDKPLLFNESTSARVGPSAFDIFRQVIAPAEISHGTREEFVNASLYFELKTFLPGILLVEDKVSMAHGLESRVPFLDNDLVDFVMRLPPRYKLRDLERPGRPVDEDEPGKRLRYGQQTDDGKLVLRRAMAGLIHNDISARVKQGFSAPDASWFRGESIDYVNGLLRAPRARIYDLLQRPYVAAVLDEHSAGAKNHRLLIWSLLSLEWWLQTFSPDL